MGLLKETMQAIIRIDWNLAAIRKALTGEKDKFYRAVYQQEPIEQVRQDSYLKPKSGIPLFDQLPQLEEFPYPEPLTIGGRLKAIRMFRRLNQTEMASEIGISSAHVSKLESDISAPSAMLIRSVSRRFNIDETWLATGHLPQATEMLVKPTVTCKVIPPSGNTEGTGTIRDALLREMPKGVNLKLDSESGRDYSQSAQ